MSSRKLALGLGLLAVFVALLLWLRSGADAVEQPKQARTTDATPPPKPRTDPRPDSRPDWDPLADEPPASSPEPEQRDHTGELLSDGPAQTVTLPEPPAGADENVPTPDESAAVLGSVIERLDQEIAAAKSAGDAAEAARLEVRRARLERKLAAREAGEPSE